RLRAAPAQRDPRHPRQRRRPADAGHPLPHLESAMTKSKPRTRRALLCLVLLAACGDNLIRDPSFDLWCRDLACKQWEVTGHITRVGPWHDRDYGVSLSDGAVISQLSQNDPVSCIEFEVIADVAASAQVQIEMDFLDDGMTEYSQPVPESHWQT